MSKNKPAPVGLSPGIPLDIRRDLQKLSTMIGGVQNQTDQLAAQTATKFGKGDLPDIIQATRTAFSPGGDNILNLTGMPGAAIAGVPGTTTVHFSGGFTVGGTTYHDMVFTNGTLTKYS